MLARALPLCFAAISPTLSLVAAEPEQIAGATVPNVVLIVADDLGVGSVGCYGNARWATPGLDRIAREGMLFTDAHSPDAVCSPSRYGLLTGRYCWRTPLRTWVLRSNQPLWIDPYRLTLPAMLRKAGYHTGLVGKWHLGLGDRDPVDWTKPLSPGPLEIGFDEFFGLAGGHNMPPQAFISGHQIAGLQSGEIIEVHVEGEGRRLVQKRGLSHPPPVAEMGRELARRAVGFIDSAAAKSKPFFLLYTPTQPHDPVVPSQEFAGKTELGRYADTIAELDQCIADVLESLDRNHLADRTLVIVTSDNGADPQYVDLPGHNPNHPWRGHKRGLYEGGHRVPFLVRWPAQVRPGSTSSETVSLTDVFATLARLVGQPLPENAAEDSFDFSPALRGGPPRDTLVAHVFHSVANAYAIREGRWKLILAPDAGDWGWQQKQNPERPTFQLFDLTADPGEQTNRALEQPELVHRLTEKLDQIRHAGRSRAAP